MSFGHLLQRYAGRMRNIFLSVGINISDIGTAIKAGIQAERINDLVLVVLPDKQYVNVIYGGMIRD